MTSIWNATDKKTAKPTMRIPVDVSASGEPSHVTMENIANMHTPNSKLRRWNAALAKQLVGSDSARVLCVGDSTTFGSWSTGSSTGEQKELSYPSTLSKLFTNFGADSQVESVWGWGGTYEYNIKNDSRISYTGTPARSSDFTIGGGAIELQDADTLTFTPNSDVDTVVIYALTLSFLGSISTDIDGGAAVITNTGLPNGVITPIVMSTTLGSHSLNIKVSGASGTVYIMGFEAYDSSKKQIHVMNAGSPSAQTAHWNTSTEPWMPINSWDYFNPDLVLISLGINDWRATVTSETYKSNLQSIITSIKTANIDVAILTPNPDASYLTEQVQYINALYELADDNDIAIIDINRRLVSHAHADNLGLYHDGAHPLASGYADIAKGIFNVIAKS